jgi:hypothetical protein
MNLPSEEQRVFPLAGLKALALLEGLHCGPLSPLARVRAPPDPADATLLMALLGGLQGDWESSIPALIDPGLTLGIIIAGSGGQLLGQYLWADRSGGGPGFKVSVADQALILSGPVSLHEVELSLLDQLGSSAAQEPAPESYELDAAQFWTLLALADAFGMAAARRQAERARGAPVALTVAEIIAGWQLGLARPDPGWAVPLAAALVPDAVPRDFPALLAGALQSLQDAALVTLLAANGDDPGANMVLPASGIDLLCRGLWQRELSFGLVRSESLGPHKIEVSQIAGWRSGGVFALADLSGLDADRAEMLVMGATDVEQLIADLLGTRETPSGDEAQTPALSSAELISRLGALKPARPAVTSKFCAACEAPLRAGARFCGQCGKAVTH